MGLFTDGFKLLKKASEPLYKTPKSIQETIEIMAVAENGIFEVSKNKYSKCYRFQDINYTTATEDEQIGIFERYCKFLNSLDCNYKITINNKNKNMDELRDKVLIAEKNDGFNNYRSIYNDIIEEKIIEGRQGIEQERYLTITIERKNFEEAKAQFATLEATIHKAFIELGAEIVPLNGNERLKVLYDYYHLGDEGSFDFNIKKAKKVGADFRNDLCNGMVKYFPDHFEDESKFCKALFIKKYPSSLSDRFINEITSLPVHSITSIAAPYGYVVNDKYVNISVDTDTAFETDGDTNDAIITVEYSDAPAVGEMTVEKKGEVLDGFKGGLLASSYEKEFVYKEGSLAGAKFKVYAAEDIYTADNQKDADGNRIKYYSKGDLVTTLTTGKDGKATAKKLPLGQYRVVEVEAPYGYVLNPNEQKVTFTYVDDKTPVIKESLTFSDDRQKLDMSVTKLDAEDKTPIAGAVFGLYADEDIKNADGKVIIDKGTLLEKATSDENGKIAFVKDYPFAKYVARELVKPAGYVTNEEAVNFDTKYQGQDVKTAVYNSEYKNTPTTFEFTKTDITSGAELTGATLTVLDKDGNVVDTWTSDAKEAHVIKRLVVGETYTLREEFAPYGYLKATDIQFTVEDTGKVQHVEMKDEVPTGSIVINKDGEFVTDTTLMKGYWYDFIFNFFKDSLAGVTFDVYAKENIVSADGLDTVYHKAGDKVATIVTNDKGIARIDDLPIGKYYLVETKTIDGFVLDDTPIEADLSYIDQNTKVVFAGMDVTNERQKVQITVTKTDSETKKALEGAVFGLFAKEDIVNKDGTVIVKADTQIERTVTGKDGKAAFTSDLPLGQYYVKEIEAPKGYVKSDKIFDVDASYQGDKVKVIEFEAAFENAPIKVEISKTDITGKKELPGAKLSVIDADGKLIESWTSEAGKTHMIERLPVGKYTLREESAPYGYKVASDVTFEVKETAEIQKVSMKDEQAVGKIVIEKTDKVTGKPIEGVVFEVRDKDGKVLDTLTTDKNGHAESKELPICTYNEDGSFKEDIHYTVVETKTADGYILDETAHDVTLRYDDNAPDVVVATLKLANVPTEPKLPQTGDNANPLLYLGIGALALITGVGVGLRGRKKKKNQ